MALNEALRKIKYDTRLVEWHLKNNQLTKEEYQKHLDQMPDVSHNIDITEDRDLEDLSEDEGH